MWEIYSDALHAKARGESLVKRAQAEKFTRKSELHLLDAADREARMKMGSYGPGMAVVGQKYTRYYPEAKTALVELNGPIYRRANTMDTSGAQSTGMLMATLRELSTGQLTALEIERDAEGYISDMKRKPEQPVSKVLFAIDGPGGEATQIDEAAALVHSMGQQGILTVGFAEGLAASAHYYLMAPMRMRFASRMSLVGSIGVVMGVGIPADKDAEGRNIIETPSGKQYVEFVNSDSPMKRADPTTEEGMAYYQNLVDKSADVFISDAARYIGMPEAEAREKLRGKVFDPTDAKDLGLIDDIGSFDEVFDAVTEGSLTPVGPGMVVAA